MYLIFKSWTWIILTSAIHIIQSVPESGRAAPYDVFLPPDGDGESKPPVIMLHGLIDWRKSWKMIAPKIAKNTGRKVYAYDALNHGENKWTDNFDVNMLVLELDQFMQQHNISKAILVGHSLGGKTSMYFSVQKPERVEKIIVEDISPQKPTPRVAGFLRQALQFSRLGLKQFSAVDERTARIFMLNIIERIFKMEKTNDLSRDYMLEWIPITKRGETFDLLANLNLFIKIGNTLTPEELDPGLTSKYNGDALFLCGTSSPFKACTDQLIPEYFPNFEIYKFQGGSHVLHFQFFKEYIRVVSDFINKEPSIQ